MIKRLNQYIIAKIWGIRLRPVAATILGACAGLSLTAMVLPTAISSMGVTDDFSARFDLAGLAVYSVLWWALGGWSAQKASRPWAGGLVLGVVGLTSGAFFTWLTYGPNLLVLAASATAGLAYGIVGGVLIATALAEVKEDPPA
ncbi:MAG: hypothetical protein PHH58_05380 [Rhodoferax sp.]|nr:hypothetical protein [Rhodoferax sp.]